MRPLPQKVVDGLPTKSSKIRALHASGFSRVEIAAFLKISYQHVRGVLVQSGTASTIKNLNKEITSKEHIIEKWHFQRLINAGFSLIAECQSLSDTEFQYSARAPTSAGVYAFAVDGWITYIGLTRHGLRTRLGHYVYGHAGQKTSYRIKGKILAALSEGKIVSVLIAQPPQLAWNGLPIDGPSGLETGLISLIRPPWNQQGMS